jgi:CHC2 zinc finger
MDPNLISEAKQRLPLSRLLAKIGDEKHAKKSARCPFHEDHSNSFSVFTSPDGAELWKCFTGCGTGDGVDYLERRFGLSTRDAITRYIHEAGLNGAPQPQPKRRDVFNWQACVEMLTTEQRINLAEWRGFSIKFVQWLYCKKIVGSYKGQIAFAVCNHQGAVVSCHYRKPDGAWGYEPRGKGTHPLIFGDTKTAGYVLVFESQWDAFAVMDKLGWHTGEGLPNTAVFVSRGASNGKLIAGRCCPEALVYAFVQNDEPKADGTIPAEEWLADVSAKAACKVLRVITPAPHGDANDWTRAGASKAEIETAIRSAKLVVISKTEANVGEFADSSKITAFVRGEIVRLLLDDKTAPATKRSLIANAVVEALAKLGRFYFHADLRDFDTAMFFDAHRKRLERIRSDAFGAWLSEWIVVNRADALFRFILAAVETAALSEAHSQAILPEAYFAARENALYLSSGDGTAAKITASGVAMVDNGTDGVLFAAGRTLAPWGLTTPHDPFETCSIFRNLHCAALHGKDLFRLWLYSLPTIPRSKPPICFAGEIGSGKTRIAKAVAEFYGLPFIAHKAEEDGENQFWPCLDQGGLFTLDNADTRNRWLADALAAAATDGCSQRRKLYSNADTVTLRARAWLCVTTANPTFASDAGLADRLLLVRMERRADETSDGALTDEILAARDTGLSHIAETLHKALADTSPTVPGLNARHPDFAAFAVRLGRALDRETEATAALEAAEHDKSAFCLENDTIACALLGYLHEARSFTGTAKELAPHIIAIDPDLDGKLSVKRLGKRLAALWPHLSKALPVCRKETGHGRSVTYTFKCPNGEYGEFQTVFS